MNGFAKVLVLATLSSASAFPGEPAVIESVQAEQDVVLSLDPASKFWSESSRISMDTDAHGKVVPAYRTEVRTRWTTSNLYFLFVCPYEQLNLKPSPNTQQETNELWNWDVAEVFLGSDFQDIRRYKEFEVSPQGEWIDLDIDLHKPHHEQGWTWNSGFRVMARIDPGAHLWYGAMSIPWKAMDSGPPGVGTTLRINLFRSQGPVTDHHEVTWQAPMSNTFHTPERFGLIRLVHDHP
jgi:Carbohydrate family 9 binding domain-like